MNDQRRFAVGHRVIVTGAEPELNGYYGHVTMVIPVRTHPPSVVVLFEGRAAEPANAKHLGEYGMFEDEIQHAD
jgi:hypothetical protein